MLALASATPTTPTAVRTDLVFPRTVRVEGRVCSTPVLCFTSTGTPVAHFLLDCDELADMRIQRLARRDGVLDVTVWGADAVFIADTGSASHFRHRLVVAARKALPEHKRAEALCFEISAPITPLIRSGVRVAVEGTPRRGCWHPMRSLSDLPLGLVAECVQPLQISQRRTA
jgi:hypothetical protein